VHEISTGTEDFVDVEESSGEHVTVVVQLNSVETSFEMSVL
jgi:hypothetical protein